MKNVIKVLQLVFINRIAFVERVLRAPKIIGVIVENRFYPRDLLE